MAVQDVAVEQRADPRPVRGEGARPVRAEEPGKGGDRGRRIVVERLQERRQRRRRVDAAHLGAHLVGRRGEHLGQLVLEVAERAARGRVDEVGRVGAGALERAQHADVEVRDALARRGDPGQVERLRLGVVERADAVVELHQRRDREANVRDVLRPEAEADHLAESKSLLAASGPTEASAMTASAMTPERHLHWDGCANVRDLGGLRTSDGGEIRPGAIVRADALDRLSADGWAALEAHGVRTVIDLRNDDELATDLAPRPAAITTLHLPLDGVEDTEFWKQWHERPEFGTPIYYRPFLDHFPDRTAAVLTAIARARAGWCRDPLRHRP